MIRGHHAHAGEGVHLPALHHGALAVPIAHATALELQIDMPVGDVRQLQPRVDLLQQREFLARGDRERVAFHRGRILPVHRPGRAGVLAKAGQARRRAAVRQRPCKTCRDGAEVGSGGKPPGAIREHAHPETALQPRGICLGVPVIQQEKFTRILSEQPRVGEGAPRVTHPLQPFQNRRVHGGCLSAHAANPFPHRSTGRS